MTAAVSLPTSPKVLVVDDAPANLIALGAVLKPLGLHVVEARSGRQALELLNDKTSFVVALLDVQMPEMDGIDATRAIREIVQFQSLPIISLTAKAMKGDREKALAAGASEYVTKPVDPERLLAILHQWLARDVVVHRDGPIA